MYTNQLPKKKTGIQDWPCYFYIHNRCLYVFMIFPSGHRILPATLIMPTWSCSVNSCPDFGEHRILRCVFNAAPIIILSNS